MPRRSKTAVEEGYLRSLWEELDEIARDYAGVCTITMYPTSQRGVFTVEFGALVLSQSKGGDPIKHSITKRLPDGGSLPFAGALWHCADQLNALVSSNDEEYERLITRRA